SLEVLDLRSIVPMDYEAIYATARKTSRVLIAHEDSVFMGIGAEVAARLAENCLDALDAPVLRVGAADCFVPSAPNLEEAILPKRTSVQQVLDIAQQGFDVAFNLCDGAWAEDRPGIEVVQALERINMAFTGAGSVFYEPTREAMKMACESVGVKFPAYLMARN